MKAPFRSPISPTVTQEFGNKSNNAWYASKGVIIPFHNGVDVCFGDPKQTYGTECVCPFEKAKVVKVTWDSPTSTKGNGVTIESSDVNGVIYQVVFWHTAEIVVKVNQELKLGDVICYIGNTGICFPSPSMEYPWNGSHSHLMLFKYVWATRPNGSMYVLQDSDNGVGGAIDPRLLFDFTQWFKGKDTDGFSHDGWVLTQYLKYLSGQKLVDYLKRIKFW